MPVANEEETMGGVLDEILALPYDNLYIYPVTDNLKKWIESAEQAADFVILDL